MIRYVEVKLVAPKTGALLDLGVVLDNEGRFEMTFDLTGEVGETLAMIVGRDFAETFEARLSEGMGVARQDGEDPLGWLQRQSTMYLYFSEPKDFPPPNIIKMVANKAQLQLNLN